MEELMWYESGQPVLLRGQAVSPHYFSMLSITAGQGRVFTRESVKQAPDSIVVTHLFWERRLGADPNVIGRKLLLTGRPYTITAVLPQGFRSIWGIGIAPSIYLPAGTPLRNPSLRYEMLAMLAPGQTLAEFRSRVLVKAKDLEASEPKENEGLARVQTFSVHRYGLLWSSGGSMLKALVLFASVLTFFAILLAVVASVNVAGLLVARAMARQREIAIRISIGCGKMRLARLLLVESLVLALSGVGAGALLSLWISRVLVAMPLPFPVPIELDVPVDLHLFAYLALLTGIATVVTGFAPVLQAWRVSVAGGVSAAPRAHGFRRWSLRGVLIAAQVAISTVLLVSTSLFIRSLSHSTRIDPGFDLDRVAIVEADTRTGQLKDAEAAAFYRAASERLKSAPGVTAVSGAIVVPLSRDSIVNSLQVDRGDREQNVTVNTNWILPEYFRTMGIALREGRDFTEDDRHAKSRVAIVNETFARLLFPNQSAIGKRVRRPAKNPEPWAEIVAVAADSRYMTLGEETRPQIYWAFGPDAGGIKLHVRTEGDAAALARSLPEILKAIDARVSTRSQPLSSVMAIALFPARAAALLLGALGLVGWALTIAGIYGVVSFTLAQRVPEIGLRMALGAQPFSVMRLLMRDGLAITAVGLAIGLVLAALATPLLATFLSGVPPHDAGSFVLTVLVLIGTALIASYEPARRGMRLSPMDALRND